MPKFKTEGPERLFLSLMSFNGTGYADMSSADAFYDSYILYKRTAKRRDVDYIKLAVEYRSEMIPKIKTLLSKTNGASRTPHGKHLVKFQAMQKQVGLL